MSRRRAKNKQGVPLPYESNIQKIRQKLGKRKVQSGDLEHSISRPLKKFKSKAKYSGSEPRQQDCKNISLYHFLTKRPPLMAGRMRKTCTQIECKYFKYTTDTGLHLNRSSFHEKDDFESDIDEYVEGDDK